MTEHGTQHNIEDDVCFCNSDKTLLLPKIESCDIGKNCLVIDLDETLIHRSYEPIENADFVVQVEDENEYKSLYVVKRPHLDLFLNRMNDLFECVLFTASDEQRATPVIDAIDRDKVLRKRLFQDSTVSTICSDGKAHKVKDLRKLGRDLNKVIILDNNPNCYFLNQENALPITDFFGDKEDQKLLELIPVLEKLSASSNVRESLKDILSLERKQNMISINEPNNDSQPEQTNHEQTEKDTFSKARMTSNINESINKQDSGIKIGTRSVNNTIMQDKDSCCRVTSKENCCCKSAIEIQNENLDQIIIIQNRLRNMAPVPSCSICFKECLYCTAKRKRSIIIEL